MTSAMNAIAEAAANISKSSPGVGGPGAGISTLAPTKSGAGAEAMPFSDLLTDAVNQVSGLESSARAVVGGLMTGSGVDVHQAMIATEKASMAFELVPAVRNKAVQAYQSVMAMQF
jgi:flagellar hook-basal body complex protein FliE